MDNKDTCNIGDRQTDRGSKRERDKTERERETGEKEKDSRECYRESERQTDSDRNRDRNRKREETGKTEERDTERQRHRKTERDRERKGKRERGETGERQKRGRKNVIGTDRWTDDRIKIVGRMLGRPYVKLWSLHIIEILQCDEDEEEETLKRSGIGHGKLGIQRHTQCNKGCHRIRLANAT